MLWKCLKVPDITCATMIVANIAKNGFNDVVPGTRNRKGNDVCTFF